MFGVCIASYEIWTLLLAVFDTTTAQAELAVIRNQHVDIEYSISHNNHCQRDKHRIQLYRGTTIADCVTECALRPHCEALSYHRSMELCQLFTQHDETDFTMNGCDHVVRSHIHVRKSPCYNNGGCSQNFTCDTNTRTCVIKECVESPNVKDGVMLGNRKEVGKRVFLKCEAHFLERNRLTYTTCTDTGIWFPSLKCIPGVITGSGVYYAKYLGKDISGTDLSMDHHNTFYECSQSCEAKHKTKYKSIQYCEGRCYCKYSGDVQLLRDIRWTCGIYIKMQ